MVQPKPRQARRTVKKVVGKNPSNISVKEVLSSLEKLSNQRIRDELMPRYGIHTEKAFGIGMANIHELARKIGRNHELALSLWQTGWYEARLLAAFVDNPAEVTTTQMDQWCRDFDNWGVVDTICFKLFDKTPFAFAKVAQWSKRKAEFEKRAAFALLASLSVHDKTAPTEAFERCLPLIEKAANDDRNFVKKGVSWALRTVGRRNPELHSQAVELAGRLSISSNASERWIGRAAVKELTSAPVLSRLKARQVVASKRKKKS
ncbi:MAG TPA: DNA alkylation repair protein [Pyrinomonadaceae bacterium]|nr:DNA alkylation repair protein [Pyrinomonadaceae bacterium]